MLIHYSVLKIMLGRAVCRSPRFSRSGRATFEACKGAPTRCGLDGYSHAESNRIEGTKRLGLSRGESADCDDFQDTEYLLSKPCKMVLRVFIKDSSPEAILDGIKNRFVWKKSWWIQSFQKALTNTTVEACYDQMGLTPWWNSSTSSARFKQ